MPTPAWGARSGRAGARSPYPGEGRQVGRNTCLWACHLPILDEMGWDRSWARDRSFMGQLFLHLGAYVHLQKTTVAPSAWGQLGFEEGCLQDTDCLIFTAGGRRGLLRTWHRGRFVLVTDTLPLALLQFCFASCCGTGQGYAGPW